MAADVHVPGPDAVVEAELRVRRIQAMREQRDALVRYLCLPPLPMRCASPFWQRDRKMKPATFHEPHAQCWLCRVRVLVCLPVIHLS